jgi:hypothetical protein
MRVEKILTQRELIVDLSLPAMRAIIGAVGVSRPRTLPKQLECEIDNFVNLLTNMVERGIDKAPQGADNTDLL